MFSPLRLTGSCFAPKAIGVALVALSLAGCGPDITRLENRSDRAAGHSLHPNSGASSTRTASGHDPFFVVRPEADVPVARASHSDRTAGLPSPKNALAHVWKRQQRLASKEGHAESRKKEKSWRQQPIADAEPRTPSPAKTQKAEPQSGQAEPPFQWPLNGKILTSFGTRSDGLKSEGIAIAVPEDTPITSAKDGEVIYAGSGLEGYGNLVLVRHANDYVTIYGHAKEISVRRGDQVKRGQIIGSSGQTGNVSTPQLYFEIRKGIMPVDPMPLLAKGTHSPRAKQGGA
jgi:murein DD-endopeptidase MepM/ murein hydrolase activator NlpD